VICEYRPSKSGAGSTQASYTSAGSSN
jgi:hypothetical protein